MPMQCCIPCSSAHEMHDAQLDRPSARVIARRRGAHQTDRTDLVFPSSRDAYATPAACANGAVNSAGGVSHHDSQHPCAQKMHDVQQHRPSARVVHRRRGAHRLHRTVLAFPSLRGLYAAPSSCANAAVSSASCISHYDLQHHTHNFVPARATARAEVHACDRGRSASTLPCAHAVHAPAHFAEYRMPLADAPLLLASPLFAGGSLQPVLCGQTHGPSGHQGDAGCKCSILPRSEGVQGGGTLVRPASHHHKPASLSAQSGQVSLPPHALRSARRPVRCPFACA
mmetsp:Transcript_13879/g.30105  ORF Transcript_13879/g.30105 Transcript_13879/m.30105 type:complete len:284 (+) Transcript_13879:331-1182(+)